MRFSLLRKLFGRKNQPSPRPKPVRVRPRLEYLEDRTLLSVTWQVQSDYFGVASGSESEPRSLRGLALTSDNQNLYGGFIQGTVSADIREVSSSVNTSLIGNDGGSPTNSLPPNPPYTTGLEASVTTFYQPKGLATDDRGNVYATLNSGSNSLTQQWTIYNSSLTTQVASEDSTNYTATSQLSDIATAKIDGNYYVYVGWKNGQIERWNVDNPSDPVLDTSFGSDTAHPGTISLKTINTNAYLDGLTVDTNGDIYVAGGLLNSTADGDALIKIPAAAAASGNLATATSVAVKGGADGMGGYAAMDVALFAGQAYVTEYLAADSTIAVFNTSDLSSAGIITPTNPTGPSGLNATFPTGSDSGFSDIAISTDGQIYVAEQLYNSTNSSTNYTPPGGTAITGQTIDFDRIMVSSAMGVAPAITSADNTTFTVGTPGSFTVTTTGLPTPSLSETGALPTGVSFVDNGDGTATLSGTPAVSTGGTYSFTITASNGVSPPATQSFTLTDDEAPSITSANSTTFTVGTPGTFTVTTGHSFPANAALSETGTLPTGVSFVDNGNGTATLSGTPSVGTGGTYTFTIDASNGVSPDATQIFTLTDNETPSITSITPSSGTTNGGTSVTINGTGFFGATGVQFGNNAGTHLDVVSNSQITVTSPAGIAGPVDVTVTNGGGTSADSTADVFTYLPIPVVAGVAPNSGLTSGGTSVTINGIGFTGATAVQFGSTNAASFHIVNDDTITAVTPAGNLGFVDVTVTASGVTSAAGAPDRFTYVASGTPIVTSLSPNSGPTSGGGFPLFGGNSVSILGSGFTGATKVQFGTVSATFFSVLSDNKIVAVAPGQSAGTVNVTVAKGAVTSVASTADQYTYLAANSPSVSGLGSSSGPANGGNTVTIRGTNLSGATAVDFGAGNPGAITADSATSITVTAPAGAGIVDVTVTTPNGVSATSAADQYTFVAAPTVTAVNSSTGPVGGNNTVTISGSGFTGATAVNFGSTAATRFTVVNSSTITAVVPPATGAGAVAVTVVTAGGTSGTSSDDQYTYVVQTPSITSLLPTSGSPSGGNTVTIDGSGFTGATAVQFGSTVFDNPTVVSDSQITVTAPAGTGMVNVTVTAPGGTSNAVQYSYVSVPPAPTVTGITPNNGSIFGGTSATIAGSGFTGVTAVHFGTVALTLASSQSFLLPGQFYVVSATEIVVDVPTSSGLKTGTVDVTVTTGAGTSVKSGADQYTYLAAAGFGAVKPSFNTTS